MATYQITTDKGTYQVDTEDNNPKNKTTGNPAIDMADVNKQQRAAEFQASPIGTARQVLGGASATITGGLTNKLDELLANKTGVPKFGNESSPAFGMGRLAGYIPLGAATTAGAAAIPGLAGKTLPSLMAQQGISGAVAGGIGTYENRPAGAILGGILGAGVTGISGAVGNAIKGNSKLFKAYNDKLVSDTVNSAAAKISAPLEAAKKEYNTLLKPVENKTVNGETFQKALSAVPKDLRQELIDKYGTLIVDEQGRPHTTLGNLQAMEMGLKDDIVQSKFGQSINANSYDIAKIVKQIKEVRLSQYPTNIRDEVLALDKKFGPINEAVKEMLPKITNRAGVANTKKVAAWIKDPENAGQRDYMLSDLKKLGIDLKPEVSVIRGWVNRQAQKKFVKTLGGITTEGTIIGKIIRGH